MSPHPIHVLSGAGGREVPPHQVRAHFTEKSVFVFQAFSKEIGTASVKAQRLVSPFRRDRMTWIKPSFSWMMYRSGWGMKEGQEFILRIELTRSGFEWALSHACLTAFIKAKSSDYSSWKKSLQERPIRIQWDPERTLLLEALPWRTIQIGIGSAATDMYVDEWLLGIEDFTQTARRVYEAVGVRDFDTADHLVPPETPYPMLPSIAMEIDPAGGTLAVEQAGEDSVFKKSLQLGC